MVSESMVAEESSRGGNIYGFVVQLHCLYMRCRSQVRFINVAGTQMIDQVTNGLSRDSLYKGL